jgi:hypothetical protein
MFTLVAFSESQDEAGVMAKIAAVADQHVKTAGDGITVPNLNQIIGSLACVGTTGDEARLIAPSLRRVNPLYITPLELGLVGSGHPRMFYHGQNPIVLDVNETLEAENDANPAAAEQHTIAVWLGDGAVSPVGGEIHTINAHVTVTLVAGTWEFSEITFPDALPVSDYSVVGARCVCADGVVFRFVPVGEAHRPGGICSADAAGIVPEQQRFGGLGEWFNFNSVQPPAIEILSSAAAVSATYELYIDVIKR